MNSYKIIIYVPVMLLLVSCNKALVITDVNYAQYVESVISPDSNGVILDIRNSITFPVESILKEEFKNEKVIPIINEFRFIRNANGYYFLTASQFQHVYVFEPIDRALKLKRKIRVNENPLNTPAFNWRAPAIELIGMVNGEKVLLNENGIIKQVEG